MIDCTLLHLDETLLSVGVKGLQRVFQIVLCLSVIKIIFRILGEFSILDLLMVCSPRRLGFSTPNETLVPLPETH